MSGCRSPTAGSEAPIESELPGAEDFLVQGGDDDHLGDDHLGDDHGHVVMKDFDHHYNYDHGGHDEN